jgi:hypothetical protein
MQQENQKAEPNAEQNTETDSQNFGAANALDTRIEELEKELAEAQASVLYVKAEGENIRRRAMDDIDKARKFALEKFSNELLAVKATKMALNSPPNSLPACLINSTSLKLILLAKSLTLTSTRRFQCWKTAASPILSPAYCKKAIP